LRQTNNFLKQNCPEIPIIADCKRSEMGESTKMVKQEIFDWLGFDSILVTPWFGQDTIKDYLDDETKGVGVYVHDSNPSAVEFQDLELKDGRKVYELVAENLMKNWNKNGNVFVEAGVTYLPQLKKIREIVGEEMMILVAGVGSQGGKTEDLKGLLGLNNQRMIVNSSRGIIFAGDKADKEIEYLEKVSQAAENLRKSLQTIGELIPSDSI
ncbi:MAG: orotidine-5'-phosphate decarboxylase, partial [Patescibacteria group bacterium]|nr:orotidine-5'-phosphate decarboxylase [Patescibacteria group bacterium]